MVQLDFQQFLQKRIGVGKSQYLTLFALVLVEMTDGMQAITISLITPIIREQLNLDQGQISLLTAAFYIGVAFGALFLGVVANISGRRFTLLLGLFIQIISGTLLASRRDFNWICIFRFLYGFGFGSTITVSPIVATQFMPLSKRGRTLLIINFTSSLGKLIGVGLAFIFLNRQHKHWQDYVFASTIMNFFAFWLIFLYTKQSFRFLIANNKTEDAISIINDMITVNNGQSSAKVNKQEKQQLREWASQTYKAQKHNITVFKQLYQHKRITLLLCLCWFCISFIHYGELFIVPFMLKISQQGLTQYLWMTVGELPSLILTYFLIQTAYFGRRRSLIGFFASSAMLCFFTVFYLNSFTLFLTKMFIKAVFQMLYPFSVQSYQTSIRSIGFALNSVAGRIGSTLMPFIVFFSFIRLQYSPFLIFSIISLIGAFTISKIKQDTYLKPLDYSIVQQSTKDTISDMSNRQQIS